MAAAVEADTRILVCMPAALDAPHYHLLPQPAREEALLRLRGGRTVAPAVASALSTISTAATLRPSVESDRHHGYKQALSP